MRHCRIWMLTMLAIIMESVYTQNAIAITELQCLVTLKGELQLSENKTVCKYTFLLASKQASLRLKCNEMLTNWRFNVSQKFQYQHYDSHAYKLTNLQHISQNQQVYNNVIATSNIGIEWTYTIVVAMKQQGQMLIQGKYVIYELSISYILIIYSILALVILPPRLQYYQNMQGMSLYSIFITVLLSLAVFVNICVILYKYTKVLWHNQFQFQIAFGLLLLSMSFLTTILHIYYKNRSFVRTVFRLYSSTRIRMISITLIWLLQLIGLYYYIKLHKDVSTYVFFGSGTVYYMSTFLLCKYMNKYYFSYRIVLFDCLSIFVLAICSKMYPILYYQIPNYYQLVGVYLLVMVLCIYGGIMFIVINIIKKDKNYRNKQMEMLEGVTSTLDQDISKKQIQSNQNTRKYKQMRQQSINNQDHNSSGLSQNLSAFSSSESKQKVIHIMKQ